MQRAEVIAYVTDLEARYRIDGREEAAVKFGIAKPTINKWIYGKRTRKEVANTRRLEKVAALAVLIKRKKKEVESLKARFEAMWEAL
jgi:hypothetical protein